VDCAALGPLASLRAALRREVYGTGNVARTPKVSIMNQLSIDGLNALKVKDCSGRYRVIPNESIIAAAQELLEARVNQQEVFSKPERVKSFLLQKLGHFNYEVFAVLFLDAQHRLIQYQEMFRGTVNQTAVYPREVAKLALEFNACAVILTHNHPSGSPEPSSADLLLTKGIKESLALFEIRVLDHVIVARQQTLSFAEKGLL
jgi:DNA repair protein RadC